MGRSVIGVISGVIVGGIIVTFGQLLAIWLAPPSPGFDPTDASAVIAAIPGLPLGSLLIVIVAWVVGAGFGARIALRIARGTNRWPGLSVGGLLLIAIVYNWWKLLSPPWYVLVALICVIAATLYATKPRQHAGE